MKSFLKDVLDAVFSFYGFIFMFFGAIIFLILTLGIKSSEISAKCVQAGMVQISYDGNQYCVSPSSLTQVTVQ